MAKLVVHAAKIPEAIQARGKDDRMLVGDLVYVNACNDQSWVQVPLSTPRHEVMMCRACSYIVAVNREMRPSRRLPG